MAMLVITSCIDSNNNNNNTGIVACCGVGFGIKKGVFLLAIYYDMIEDDSILYDISNGWWMKINVNVNQFKVMISTIKKTHPGVNSFFSFWYKSWKELNVLLGDEMAKKMGLTETKANKW